jgi:pilus assembly protein Flp/PilA
MWNELNRLVLSVFTRVQVGRQEGQALVEYTLILALVSIVAIGALTVLGTNIKTVLNEVATSV